MLKPILKFTGKAKCAFGLCLLLLLATQAIAVGNLDLVLSPETVNREFQYEKYAQENFTINKIFKLDESVVKYREHLLVKYNPFREMISIKADLGDFTDSVYAVINVYDIFDSVLMGRSSKLDLNYIYRGNSAHFVPLADADFVSHITVDLRYKSNPYRSYILSERLECSDGSSYIFSYCTASKCYLTCDSTTFYKTPGIKNLDSFFQRKLSHDAMSFIKLEKYKDCSDTKKYFGLDSTTNECIEIATCLDGEFYDNTDNSCYTIPANSHLIENRLWECDSGYWQQQQGEYCYAIPSNSHNIDSFTWECDSGYVEVEGSCKLRVTCSDSSEIYKDWTETECSTIPSNSHRTGEYTWECDSGYVEVEGYCYAIPSNSHRTGEYTWECDDGYVKVGNQCLPHVTCSESEIYKDWTETECSTIPANSHKIGDFMWACDDGYLEMDGSCILQVTCSESEIYKDWTETECSTIPANSHKTDNFTWICDDGYWQQGDSCVSEQIISPYVRRHVDISAAGGFFNITHIKTNNDKVTHAYESSKPFDLSFGLEYGIQRINTRMDDTLSSLGFNIATGLLLNKRKFEGFYSDSYKELSPNWYIELGLSLNIYSIGVYAYIRPINCILASRKIEPKYSLPDSEYMLVNNFGILLGKNFNSHFGLFAGYESLKTLDGPIVPSFEFRARFTF